MSIGHVVLGILADGPAHGYDLKHIHDERFPGAKELPFGQVYSTLARLQRDGLVTVAATTQGSGPERTAYALTEMGHEALDEWLMTTEPAGPYAADELVRKAVTALRLRGSATEHFHRQREVHLERMRELLRLQREATTVDARIAIDHTINHLDADLRWLESAVARVAAEGGHS
jgi:DNA-binding PadR family transcriptional regulator